ncbi:MAG: UDP-N-acetylmuramoyl-L-alanyl-D-glutamate--2,6-diaminopimelate ligase [Candidatus Sungiibacteriota bacterium]
MERLLNKIKKYFPQELFRVLQPSYHFALVFIAALWYLFPSRRLIVIGITGTKGKTTVVHLAHEILEHSGAKTASLSSVRFKIGEREEMNESKMTMPGRFFVQRFLYRAAQAGCHYAVIEVTSQGIAQSRHRFIRFSSAVMTNIAPEHIEYHGNFEKYIRAKLDLFWRLGKGVAAIINRDDQAAGRFAAATSAHRAWYSRERIVIAGKTWLVEDSVMSEDGISFDSGGYPFISPLRGEFNFYNILAAVTVGLSRHISLEKIAEAVNKFSGVPGRMEFVRREPFAVVVDYAHTPDSLRKVYETLRHSLQPITYNLQPRLICVLGATGGGRDRWKRPEFGKIAKQFCDCVILTDEDPYDENPEAILDAIASGFSQHPHAQKILDRRSAIRAAVQSAKLGDTVIITGKGAEPWMMKAGGTRIPWDDRAVAREEIDKLS